MDKDFNKNIVASGLATGCSTGDTLDHDMEYIGAPGGTEDNGAKVYYVSIGEFRTVTDYVELPTTDIEGIEDFIRDYFYKYLPTKTKELLKQTVFTTTNLYEVQTSLNSKYSLSMIPDFFKTNSNPIRTLKINGIITTQWLSLDINPVGQILIIQEDER